MSKRLIGFMLLAALIHARPGAAQAQFRPYAGASLGSFDVSADDVDGKSAAAGVVAGVTVSRLVDIEVDLQFPTGTFDRSHTGVLESLAPPGSTLAEIERLSVHTRIDHQRDVSANVSVVAIIHPPRTARVVPAIIAGVANQRVHDRTVYTPVRIPPGLDPGHRGTVVHEERSTRNLGGPTIGGNVSIALGRQLYLVPDVRFDYGSIGDEINNALRASVRLIWRR